MEVLEKKQNKMYTEQDLLGKGGKFLVLTVLETHVFCREKFSEEQKMIASSAKDFAKEQLKPISDKLNNVLDEELTRKIFRKVGELGFLGVEVPEKFGGLELDKTTASIVVDCLSTGESASIMVSISAHTGIAMLPIIWYGNDKQKEKYLPKMASGEFIGCFALTEPGAGSDVLAASTKAELNKDKTHYILNGQKIYITNGSWADISVVFAMVDNKYTAFIIEKDCEGLVIGAEEKKLGIKGSSTASLFFENCKVPIENVLGEVGQGGPIAFNVLYPGRYKLGVTTCSGSKYLITAALAFAFDREQFSRSVANFGMIKNKFANMVTKSWESDSINYMTTGAIDEAVQKLDKNSEDYYNGVQKIIEDHSIEASISKILGSETLAYTVDEGLQIMGGAGFIEEYPMAGAYRDERINRIFEGTNEINRMIIGGYVLKKSILEEIPIRICIQERINQWIPDNEMEGSCREYFEVVEFCRSLLLNITNHLILKYGQDLKNEQWILEPFTDLIISFSIIDIGFKRFYGLDNNQHKNNTEKVFRLSLANHFYNSLEKAQVILEFTENVDMINKIKIEKDRLNYQPNRIKYKQDIIIDLYKYKKYYLD
jgi:alkylation response protein AidB-like acyl-CoA dehydrogenase